ncbi:allophanate hydrolase subunit 1 [Alteromonas aestuariivivens]|uniref:Allophanate hydrolase subunit 1 n=1 Tax=Alteromonas aestuariivivens TaxID=1938339 RepID=A0A3D8MB11_9ALTE|nr:5-oxoprolinase subunit PxpB [Alteromonas aestuariivivens]RDV27397.1 allophanate hydrolase subunit 1 [Alteromonas aestuariivivens]
MRPFGRITDIRSAGLDGLILYFGGDDLTQSNQAVQHCVQALQYLNPTWLKELLPAYDSLTIVFDPWLTDDHGVYRCLAELPMNSQTVRFEGHHHRLPVWYGASQCNDFEHLCSYTGLLQSQIVDLHTQARFRVFAVGFAPGFAYLGELPEQLACPRLATPRKRVPKGAVAIADRQTAVYPQASPGGWNLLGLCPVPMFDVGKSPASLLAVGDTVQFEAISEQQYQEWCHER